MAKKSESKVKFKDYWSGDLGYFAPGLVTELPADIAKSLAKEGVVELLDAPEEKAE